HAHLSQYTWRDVATGILARLAPIDLAVIRSREFALWHRLTLAELGNAHELSRERIRQIEARALQRLADALDDSNCQPLLRASRRLRSSLGSACPLGVVSECWPGTLNEAVDADNLSNEALLMLWHAGPYE